MKFYLSAFFILFFSFSFAQSPADLPVISLSGTITEAGQQKPLAAATVTLIALTSGQRFSTTTDSSGFFVFNKLKAGKYKFNIAYIGYTNFEKEISLTTSQNAGTTELTPVSGILETVTVTGTKSLIENKPDKLVYNVDKDISSQGGVATDVLKKIPQVSVDINGNVEILGNPGVKFLINGQKSTAFGKNAAEALQSIPTSLIQSIEVISSPGAKYEAAGTGGIINIILKKNKTEGFSGSVNATAGTRLENGSLNLTYKKNKTGFNLYFSGNDQLQVKSLISQTRNSMDTASRNTFLLVQNGYNNIQRSSYMAGFGWQWDVTPKDNIAVTLEHQQFGNKTSGYVDVQNSTATANGNNTFNEYSYRNVKGSLLSATNNLNFLYQKKFNKENEKLSLSYQLSFNKNTSAYRQQQQYRGNDSIFSGSGSFNPGKEYIHNIELNYSHPFSQNFTLETGARADWEQIHSNADVYSFNQKLYAMQFDPAQTYSYTFNCKIYAAYISAGFTLADFLNVVTGIRWEHTLNKATYSNAKTAAIPDYNNLAPSVTISHSFAENRSLKLSYAYRLERPDFEDMNPFVNLSDPHNITAGNPLLQPEIGHSYQLNYQQTFTPQSNINITLLYSHNSPDIKSYTTFYPTYKIGDSLYENVNFTTRANIADETRYGINISGAATLSHKLNIRPGIQLYERQTNSIYSIPPFIKAFEYRGTLNINLNIAKNWIAEAFGSYRSGMHWQGRRPPFSAYTFSVRKQLWNGKGSLGVTAINVFSKYLTQKAIQEGSGFSAVTAQKIPYRSVGISFQYKFGKLKQAKQKDEENLLTKPVSE